MPSSHNEGRTEQTTTNKRKKTMLNLEMLKPGNVATFVLDGPFTMNKNIRTEDGREPNPLLDRVTRHTVYVGNIAGRKTWDNVNPDRPAPKVERHNPYTFKGETDKSVVQVHDNGTEYVGIVNPKVKSHVLFVDGKEADAAQLAVISAARPPKRDRPTTGKEYRRFKLDTLENLEVGS